MFDDVNKMIGFMPGSYLYYTLKYITPAFVWVSNAEHVENKILICSHAWKGKALLLMEKHNVRRCRYLANK